MKKLYLLIIVIATSIISCQTNDQKDVPTVESILKEKIITKKQNPIQADTLISEIVEPKVLLVPCSNGYEYEIKQGSINPFLERILKNDKRIEFVPFPYKKMKGSGYFGVFDKKNCSKIIANTAVDFIVMTKMFGGDFSLFGEEEKPNWGYATRILNTKTMEQFNGISGNKFDSFEALEKDIESKKDVFIQLIVNSKS